MTRIAAMVFLINTFLPILIVIALVWAGSQVLRTYETMLQIPIERIEEQIAVVGQRFSEAKDRIEETRDVVAVKAAEVEVAVATAAEPFNAVSGAFEKLAALQLSKTIPVPTVKQEPVRVRGKEVKIRTIIPWEKRTLTYPKVGTKDLKLTLGLPAPVKTAFETVGAGFAKMLGFVKPMGEMVDAVKKLAPDLDPLRQEMAALNAALSEARRAAARARDALTPLNDTVKWMAYLIGPWILLSYVCWVWLRLRAWRRIMTGAG